jgi:Hemerythrin HHE cation binding domain
VKEGEEAFMAQKRGSSKTGKQASSKERGGKKISPYKGEREKDLYGLLKEDHEKLKDLFSQIEEEGEMEARQDLFSQIEEELDVHMEGEEKYFYPPLEEDEEARKMVLEAYEEHHVAKTVLKELDGVSADNERWAAKVKVLSEIVDHHIEEEEGELFKLARKVLDREQAQNIAEQLKEAKARGA